MTTLSNNSAIMDTSRGITLKTEGRYIPHDIVVKPNSSFIISTDFDSMTISEEKSFTVSTINIDGTLKINTLTGLTPGRLYISTLSGGVLPSITDNYTNTSITNMKQGSSISIKSAEAGSSYDISSLAGSLQVSTLSGTSKFDDFAAGAEIDIKKDGAYVKVANESGLITANPTFSRSDTATSLTPSAVNAEYSSDDTSGVAFSVAASTPVPKTIYSAAAKGWIDISEGTEILASGNVNEAITKYITSISIAKDKSFSKINNNGTISSIANGISGVITSISNVSTIESISNDGNISAFSNNNAIMNYSGTGAILNYSANTTLYNFNGGCIKFFYSGASMQYDTTTKAIVFSY